MAAGFVIALFIAGLAGGFSAGLIGIGGGTIYIFIIPIVLDWLQVPDTATAQYTIANSFFVMFFASLAGNYSLAQRKQVYPSTTLVLGIPALLASLLVLVFFVNTPLYSRNMFNGIVIPLLTFMLYRTFITARSNRVEKEKGGFWGQAFTGVSGGVISSLSGLGGGIVMIPLLNNLLKMDIKKAGAVSLGVIAITSLAMTVNNLLEAPLYDTGTYSIGYIIFPVAVPMTAGVLIGSPLGVRAKQRLSSKNISYIYAFFLLIVIVKKTWETDVWHLF